MTLVVISVISTSMAITVMVSIVRSKNLNM
jgi:hypothetical protein